MSSTVSYKGSTIATVSNTTKTLTTAGKYLEDDITIVDASTPTLQTKTKSYTPTESAQSEDVTADNGYDGLAKVSVSVGAISSSYVGSAITRRSSSDLTASGATVTAPAGYYSAQATKSVSTMTLPSSTSTTSSGTSKATISRNTATRYLNIPTGYNETAQYYTISATPNGTVTAPSTISGTSATVSTGTNTLTLSKTVSVTPSVTTAGYVSSGTAGNSSVSLTASVTTKAATTITPTTSQQTAVSAGTYCTGAITVDAMPAFVTYYTGTGTPSSSLGSDGDIYLKTS